MSLIVNLTSYRVVGIHHDYPEETYYLKVPGMGDVKFFEDAHSATAFGTLRAARERMHEARNMEGFASMILHIEEEYYDGTKWFWMQPGMVATLQELVLI